MELKSVKDAARLFDEFFLSSHISVPLISVDGSDTHHSVQAHFAHRNFDVIGFKENNTVIGYLSREKYNMNSQNVKDNLLPFSIDDVIAANTPLIVALEIMQSKDRIFIMNQSNIDSLITKADVQKSPVRMLFFGLVTLLESEMANIISEYFPNDAWRTVISEDRLQAIETLYRERKQNNVEIDLIDCTQLADKRTIIISSQAIRNSLFNISKTAVDKWFKKVEALRNDLAHAQSLTRWFEENNATQLASEMESIIKKLTFNRESKN